MSFASRDRTVTVKESGLRQPARHPDPTPLCRSYAAKLAWCPVGKRQDYEDLIGSHSYRVLSLTGGVGNRHDLMAHRFSDLECRVAKPPIPITATRSPV